MTTRQSYFRQLRARIPSRKMGVASQCFLCGWQPDQKGDGKKGSSSQRAVFSSLKGKVLTKKFQWTNEFSTLLVPLAGTCTLHSRWDRNH